MKNCLFVILVLVAGFLYSGDKVIPMPEVTNPFWAIEFYKDYMYIPQKHNVQIYSMKDFSLIKEFSGKGEGPGEFRFVPRIRLFEDYILMKDLQKIMLFSHMGELIEEIKKPFEVSVVEPVPGGFLCSYRKFDRNTQQRTRGFYIYTKKFEQKKKLMEYVDDSYRFNRAKRIAIQKFPYIYVKTILYKDKIFIGNNTKGFCFEVFNLKGDKLYEINRDYEKIKITNEYRSDFLKDQKKYKENNQIKTKYDFNQYFPAFRNFELKNDQIIVTLYSKDFVPRQENRIYLDLKGNFIKNEIKDMPQRDKRKNQIIGARGKYLRKQYYLIENYEKEMWELHIEDVKDEK